MNNTYGITKPSTVRPEDVEIFYNYRPTRNSDEGKKTFSKLDSNYLTKAVSDVGVYEDTNIPGLYNLSLPADIFGKVGYYTIYIKPKEHECKIYTIGALATYPDVKGIVIDTQDLEGSGLDASMFSNNNLVGYRIEYFDENGIRKDYYRIITSCSRCAPISQNLTSSNTDANGFRYTDSGTLCFITVTPSTAPSFKSNQRPYIGMPSQNIVITNTMFDPVLIEVQVVKHDEETITTMLEGNQIRALDRGLVSTYNENGELYLQQEFYTVKDNYTTEDVFEVKKKREDNIDYTINYEELIENQ